MTGNTEGYVDFVLEMLAPIGGVSSGRFFGGLGLTSDGVQFAMLMGDSLYFVVDDGLRSRLESEGSECFWYTTKKGRVNVKKYYEVPADYVEDQTQLLHLARESIQIARKLSRIS